MTVLYLAWASVPVLAQATTATISGTVTDETGALVPGVTMTVKNVSTGIARTVLSSEQGTHRAAALEFGDYEVQAE